jgi:Bifunctional DNA primase/polymerase, N-terminal
MTAILDAALRYAARGWPVFPCNQRKKPLTENGFKNATTDEAAIRQWPRFDLIGVPTGEVIGCAVLDIDMKNGNDGFKTLADLDGCPILPPTPIVHTASGGAHLYFQRPECGLRNTAGSRGRGIGSGLDWRGDGGYVIVPSPGSGYRWGHWHFGNCQPLPVPEALLPKIKLAAETERPIRPPQRVIALSPYAEAALDKACRAMIGAPAGEQEVTLNSETFSIGTLAGAGGIPHDFALKVMIWAARQMRDYDPHRPWRLGEIEIKVRRAFAEGMRHPRQGGNHAA